MSVVSCRLCQRREDQDHDLVADSPINFGRLVEFLGETEVEMTKVSWSSKREVVGSSLVVIVTVVILGIWIAAVDIVLSMPWGAWIGGTIGRLFR